MTTARICSGRISLPSTAANISSSARFCCLRYLRWPHRFTTPPTSPQLAAAHDRTAGGRRRVLVAAAGGRPVAAALLLLPARARHPAFAPGLTRSFAPPLVRRALLVRRLAALARYIALL